MGNKYKSTIKSPLIQNANKFNEEIEKRVAERMVSFSLENQELKKQIAEISNIQNQTNKLLEEKISLLREIHHTVKNNFQVVASFLNIQIDYITDEKSIEVLRESCNRIRSIALIHEKLYNSLNLTINNFSEYIFSLCKDLFNSYNVDPNRINLKTNLNGTSCKINKINTAILCGLIINELLSNSLKHAFPNNRRGEIYVETDSYGNKYLLIVRDNGIGFPSNFDLKNINSLGLQIVNSLVDQLSGEVYLKNKECTEFRIIFPVI